MALVTGAGGALGGAVVEAFLRAGAGVAAVSRDAPKAPRIDGQDPGDRWLAVAADLASEAGAVEAVKSTIARFGRLDVLIHLVGGYSGGIDVADTTLAGWEQAMALNLTTTFLACRAVVPQMRAQGYGRIITVGSRTAIRPVGGQAAYNASKAAVVVLTQTLAEELKDEGITANCLLPSVIDTPANRKAMPKSDPSKWVKPTHLARLMVALASDEGAAVTGTAIPVSGRL